MWVQVNIYFGQVSSMLLDFKMHLISVRSLDYRSYMYIKFAWKFNLLSCKPTWCNACRILLIIKYVLFKIASSCCRRSYRDRRVETWWPHWCPTCCPQSACLSMKQTLSWRSFPLCWKSYSQTSGLSVVHKISLKFIHFICQFKKLLRFDYSIIFKRCSHNIFVVTCFNVVLVNKEHFKWIFFLTLCQGLNTRRKF